MIGKTISHYKIIEKLGEGGMGVVYKAHDTKLDRFVALKFLPRGIEADDAERARFMQEAKAASALNHPNVCVIHDLHEHEDEQFIVMEYVDGMTMREKIRAGVESVGAVHEPPMPLKDVLSYATQIGEALQEAHSRGIVHRDIKSDNIMVTAKGQVKVMDFGLAKLKGALRLTKSTSTVGTLAYMAPEQLQGKETDARMDIFSFGVVLYEMLTGHMPFKGEYESALMYSILNTEPEPVTKFRPDLSSEFLHVLNRALEKDPDDRYLTVNEMLIDLRRLKRDSSKVAKRPSVELLTPETQMSAAQATGAIAVERPKTLVRVPLSGSRSPLRYVVPALVIIILAVAGYFLLPREGETPVPQFTNPVPVTNVPITTTLIPISPTWSPDGSKLAYNWKGGIWVKQLPDGIPLNLIADREGLDYAPSWSPDGRHIAFVSDREGLGYYIMPSTGGRAQKIFSISERIISFVNPISWSPDGTKFACLVRDSAKAQVYAEIVSIIDFTSKRVDLQEEGSQYWFWSLSWSPDGNYFAYENAFSYWISVSRLWMMRLNDGKRFPVTDGRSRDYNPRWSQDGKYLYFVSDRGGGRDLWRARIGKNGIPEAGIQRITTGMNIYQTVFSPDESKIAYTKWERWSNIWRIPILRDRPATMKDAQQLTFEKSYIWQVDVSPKRKMLAFDSDRDGKRHIWIMPVEGGEIQRVTNDTVAENWPRWSSDGEEIAYYSSKGGNEDIWVAPASRGRIKQITNDTANDRLPSWSPDGKEIAFVSERKGNFGIWIIPSHGGEAKYITNIGGHPLWSPDGKWLLFHSGTVVNSQLYLLNFQNSQIKTLMSGKMGWNSAWSPDSKKIYSYFMDDQEIWEISINSDTRRKITNIGGSWYFFDSISTDGKFLYGVIFTNESQIWMMDVVKK